MQTGNKNKTTYRNGDKIRYTGKSETLYGGLFYEYEILDGHKKGQKGLTQQAPK